MKDIIFKDEEFNNLVKEDNILRQIITFTLETFPTHKKYTEEY